MIFLRKAGFLSRFLHIGERFIVCIFSFELYNRTTTEETGGETVKSFYPYLMKYRHPKPKDDISDFANHAYLDHGFPKASNRYDEISSYLELNVDYLSSMTIFDEAWEKYITETKQ